MLVRVVGNLCLVVIVVVSLLCRLIILANCVGSVVGLLRVVSAFVCVLILLWVVDMLCRVDC